jgi:hypothetical protein
MEDMLYGYGSFKPIPITLCNLLPLNFAPIACILLVTNLFESLVIDMETIPGGVRLEHPT